MIGQQLERLSMLPEFGPNLAGNVRDGLKLTVEDIARAETVRESVWKKFRDVLSRYDFLLTPTAPVTPYPVEKNFPDLIGGKQLANYIDWVASNFLVTLAGFPAGSAPCGKTAAGLPVGLQIVGARFSEPRILGLSKLVQRRAPIGWPTFAG
jgi:amidase